MSINNKYMLLNQKTCELCIRKCCYTEPIFLTQYDINRIKQKTGLSENEFVERKKGYEKPIKLMRLNKDGECIFFDKNKEGKNCLIYNIRPVDCQLFPLDVDLRNEKYFLIFYNHCDLKDNFPKKMLKEIQLAKSKIIPLLKPEIKEYAKLPMKLFDQKKWITVEELNI